jgi:hypothetical protein
MELLPALTFVLQYGQQLRIQKSGDKIAGRTVL